MLTVLDLSLHSSGWAAAKAKTQNIVDMLPGLEASGGPRQLLLRSLEDS